MGLHITKSFKAKFAGTLAVSLLVVVIMGGVFFTLASAVRESSRETARHAQAVTLREQKRSRARRSAQLLVSRGQEVDRALRYLVDRRRPVAFFEEVDRLADITRTLVTFDPVAESTASSDVLPLRITVDGERRNTLHFLKLLEQLPYEIHLEEFTFQKLSADLLQAVAAEQGLAPSGKTPETRLILLAKVKTR